ARSVQSGEVAVADPRDRERRRLGGGTHRPGALRRDPATGCLALLALLHLAPEARDVAHLLHHLLDVLELLDELAHLARRRPRAVGDARPPRPVDERRPG